MPTPYYSTDRATLYLGDCRPILAALPRLDAGLLATDPPYGVRWQSSRRPSDKQFDMLAGDDGSLDVPDILGEVTGRHLARKRHIYVFGYRCDQLAGPMALGGHCELMWDKGKPGMGDLSLPWGPQHEVIAFGAHVPSRAERAEGQGNLAARLRRGSVLRHSKIGGRSVRHPTEKPVPLMRELVESSSVPGDLVLDPFAGVGSTGVAALVAARRFVGVELDERYCEIAAQRLAEAESLADKIGAL